MAFDFKENSQPSEDQLSLLDYKMPDADFVENSSSDHAYDLWMMTQTEKEPSKTSRFVTVSAGVHIAAALLIALMSVPFVENAKTETITIEIEDTPPKVIVNKGSNVPATQGGEQIAMPLPPAAPEISREDVVAAAPTVAVAKALPAKAKAAPSVAKATKSIAPKTNFQAVPATIDDLDAPSLEEGAFAAAPVKSTLDEDFNEDLDQVDLSHQKSLAQEKNHMDALAAAAEAEQDSELGALDEDNKANAAKLTAANEALKNRNAQQVAQAIAAEKAEAQARAAGERAAAAAAARRQAKAAGQGAGNNGENKAQSQVAGAPTGIRSLDQLRQMPGNPRPQYDREERLRGHAGDVAFVAYISKAGAVTQFRMMKSTGFQSLDAKTLAALKKWRFYPGQEGWVELPFKWDLKGDAQGDGGMLRGAVSQN